MTVVKAAGCVVWRYGDREPEVLLVHRPRYDDWSFPKGKLDPGETMAACAVREVLEETGLAVCLGPSLPEQRYPLSTGQRKHVSYWAARPPADADVSRYQPNDEIDKLTWTKISKARTKLTYQRDETLLESFESSEYASYPLLVVRHADARRRKSWRGEDTERPLSAAGKRQAVAIVPLLRAYGVTRIVSSDALRCVETMLPYVNGSSATVKLDRFLSEEGARRSGIDKRMHKMLKTNESVAVCSHRPVLPDIFGAIGIEPTFLDPGQVLVAHRSRGKVVDIETHRIPG